MFQNGRDLIAEFVIFQTLVDDEVTPLQALAELKKNWWVVSKHYNRTTNNVDDTYSSIGLCKKAFLETQNN